MRLILRLIGKLFPKLSGMCRNFERLALDYGQMRSIQESKAVDARGEPIPWYTYPAIEYLLSFDFRECDVFEFGCGNSSFFWADRTHGITSVEDDEDWFRYVKKMARANQSILHRPFEENYVSSLSEQGRSFEIIAVDGKWRRGCVDEAIKYLQRGGIIILDNSERTTEMDCSKHLRDHGFFQIDFSGFGPINGYCWTTSIFIQPPTTLQQNFSGPEPIGGLRESLG
jgi:hypothetical protein